MFAFHCAQMADRGTQQDFPVTFLGALAINKPGRLTKRWGDGVHILAFVTLVVHAV